MELKRLYFCSAVAWTCIIALLCLVSFSNLPSVNVKNTDKIVHFTLHFVFTSLWISYLLKKTENAVFFKIGLVIFFISLLYGITIEIAQEMFTLSRKADVFDVCANASGSLIAIITLKKYIDFRK